MGLLRRNVLVCSTLAAAVTLLVIHTKKITLLVIHTKSDQFRETAMVMQERRHRLRCAE